jgi:hypothetical protein
MDLDEGDVVKVLDMLLSGLIPAPQERPSSGAVAAALELLDPRPPADAAGFGELLTNLYEQTDRLMKLRPQLWISHLEKLASIKLEKPPRPLNELLQSHMEAQWMVIDCLGLPLMKTVQSILPQSFPHWKLHSVEFAMVSEQTSTEAFYLGLMGGDLTKAFEKIDAVDALIHTRKLSLNDLARLVRAELDVAFRKLADRFDPGSPVLIYGDHGFRLAPDGAGFSHGGPSTAERITPVFKLMPV